MARSPAVRVSAARDLLEFVDRFEPGARQKVLDRFPAASREALEGSPRTSWLPIEHDHFVVDGVVAVLGRDRAITCWRDSVPDIVDKPLLRNFAAGMLRMFGRDPARVIGWFPKVWPIIYRDFGTLRFVGPAGGAPSLLFEDVAPEVALYPNYFVSWEGILRGFAHIAKVRGTVELVIAKDLRSAEARFSWK